MNKAKIIIGIGIPGSGKTTVLKKFAETHDYIYISPDEIRKKISGKASDQTLNKEVWEKTYQEVEANLRANKTIIMDATFTNPDQRRAFLAFARAKGVEKIQGVFFDVPREIAKERNAMRDRTVPEYAIDRMQRSLQNFPPELTDGFDSIFTLNKDQKLVRAEIERSRNNIERG